MARKEWRSKRLALSQLNVGDGKEMAQRSGDLSSNADPMCCCFPVYKVGSMTFLLMSAEVAGGARGRSSNALSFHRQAAEPMILSRLGGHSPGGAWR